MKTQPINRETIQSLARRTPGHGISILLPAHPRGAEAREDPIRLRNLLDEAAATLRALDVHDPEARVRPLRPLETDMDAWERNPYPGLAFYVEGERVERVGLGTLDAPLSVVDRAFHILPLLPAVNRSVEFHILALSQDGVRLLRADRHAAREIDLPEAPDDFGEILGLYMQDDQLQYHSGAPPSGPGRKRQSMYHGQGVANDETDRKKKLMEYCQRIEDAVRPHVAETPGPLVLAATEPLGGLYREASRDPHLHPQAIEGNPVRKSAKDLHAEATALLADRFDAVRAEAIATFGNARGRERALADRREVLNAAARGHVETLFVRTGPPTWGRWDPESGQMEMHDAKQPASADLRNRAAVETLRHGGWAYLVDPEELPDAAPLAAVLRFPQPAGQAG